VNTLVVDTQSTLGVGKFKGSEGSVGLVEYFIHPGAGGTALHPVDLADLRRARLTPQTRVHIQIDGEWLHGRVVEHDLASREVLVRFEQERVVSEAAVHVRWRRRLTDATPFLSEIAAESRRFYAGRSKFVHAYLSRATAYQQITALSSASVELHPHQVEAARRVLQDVSQRYLLADEVGLGKTIEAGILIRQHLLDRAPGKVAVVVPPALTSQWHRELANKFHLDEQFRGSFEVVSFAAINELEGAQDIGLLVIDEAHRVASEAITDRAGAARYERLAAIAHHATKLILLSATPLLQKPASLLHLLHLLSPKTYRLEELAAFEAMLANRDDIGTLYANLDPESQPTFLLAAVRGLRELLKDDAYGLSLLDGIEVALGDGDSPGLQRSVRRARAYLGEAYRMYSRMIRTRRASGLAEDFPVLGRLAPMVVSVGRDSEFGVALDAWREHLAARLETGGRVAPDWTAVRDVLEAGFAAGDALGVVARRHLEAASVAEFDAEEIQLLGDLAAASERRAAECPRLRRAAELAVEAAAAGRKVAVALGTEDAAVELVRRLEAVNQAVMRISESDPEAAERFTSCIGPAVLVFGPTGEEGQNLQAAELLIHADLPWSPNRVEQRLGRLDRFGAGEPAEQVVLVEGDPSSLGDAWFACLRDGFGVFTGSIASVQLVVDAAVPDIAQAAVVHGAAGVKGTSVQIAERLDEELQRIELAELLEETTADEQGLRLIEDSEDADAGAASEAWGASVVAWAAGDGSDAANLRFHHEHEKNEHRFSLTRFDRPDVQRLRASDLPLIPHDVLADRFTGSVDANGLCRGAFRRLTAARRESRLLGPGDPFVDVLWSFTEEDDRGRAFATWRARTAWKDRSDLLALCFDLRIYPNIDEAVETLPWDGREAAERAVRRRAEAYLPPVQERVWVDVAGNEIREATTLSLLEAPYSELWGDATIRPWLWSYVDVFVSRTDWARTCEDARTKAAQILCARHELADRTAHAAGALRLEGEDAVARIQARRETGAAERAGAEASLVTALAHGITSPKIEVDAVGVVVLSSEAIPQDELR
jgi:ATP-dependent helicase HepA